MNCLVPTSAALVGLLLLPVNTHAELRRVQMGVAGLD